MKTLSFSFLHLALVSLLGMFIGSSIAHAQSGSLDSTFNADAIAGQPGVVVAVQSDGKVIGLGSFGLMRFLLDGPVDFSFQPPLRGPDGGSGALVLQPDGRLLVTGKFTNDTGTPFPGLMRLNPDGSLDPSFNLDFEVYPSGRVLALQPDGKVVVSGFIAGPSDAEYSGLLRLRGDGSLDADFILNADGNADDFYSLALGPDGKIYFGTHSSLARLNPDGSFDGSFAPEPFLGPYAAIAVQPDGKVLVGQYGDGPGYHAMRRLLADGRDDPDWMVPAIDGGDNVVQAILVQSDQRVLLGGDNLYGINGMWLAGLGRLLPDGSLDQTFDSEATLHYYSVRDMAFAPDGKIYVAGVRGDWPDLKPAPGIWRLNSELIVQPQLKIDLTASEGITLHLSGRSGATYRLEYREQLSGAEAWTDLATLTLSGETATWQDTGWENSATRFYRAVALP